MKTTIVEAGRKIAELLPVILLAGFGGLIGTLTRKKEGQKITFVCVAAEMIIASFCGLLIHYLMLEYSSSENMRTIAIALGGYSARYVLAIFNGVFLAKLKGGGT